MFLLFGSLRLVRSVSRVYAGTSLSLAGFKPVIVFVLCCASLLVIFVWFLPFLKFVVEIALNCDCVVLFVLGWSFWLCSFCFQSLWRKCLLFPKSVVEAPWPYPPSHFYSHCVMLCCVVRSVFALLCFVCFFLFPKCVVEQAWTYPLSSSCLGLCCVVLIWGLRCVVLSFPSGMFQLCPFVLLPSDSGL